MPEERRVLLEVRNLKKHYPIRHGFLGRSAGTVKAVDGINLHILQGETLGLVGESGSGKTTAGRTILRAFNPTAGEIIFHLQDGPATDIAKLDAATLRAFRRHAQMIFQDPYSSLNPRMTVPDIIAEPLVAGGVAQGDEVDERVRETARRCQLSLEHLRRYPHAFSGGQRQRIGIARALVVQPQFVVCDEPVSALDVSIQAQIIEELRRLQGELGMAMLFITHDFGLVADIAQDVAVMYACGIREVQVDGSQEHFVLPEVLAQFRSRLDAPLMEELLAIQAATAMEDGLVSPAHLVVDTFPSEQGSQRVNDAATLYKAQKKSSRSSRP